MGAGKRRRESGLCWQCATKVAVGHTYCEKHLSMTNKRSKNARAKYKVLGICIFCGNKAITGRILCANCAYKHSIRQKKIYLLKGDALRLRVCARRQKLIEDGKCITCTAPLVDGETIRCFSCKATYDNVPQIKGVIKYETAD